MTAIGAKVQAFLAVDSKYDLMFVHRDSDNAGYKSRLTEIESAMDEVDTVLSWVPAIPVRETEAWLLLDEAAVRRVAGNPKGRTPARFAFPFTGRGYPGSEGSP